MDNHFHLCAFGREQVCIYAVGSVVFSAGQGMVEERVGVAVSSDHVVEHLWRELVVDDASTRKHPMGLLHRVVF